MRSELESTLHLAKTLPAEQLPQLLGELEQIRVSALARLTAPRIETRPDELLTVTQTAARLKVSRDYLYRNHSRLPFTRRQGRKLLFSSNGLESYLKKSR